MPIAKKAAATKKSTTKGSVAERLIANARAATQVETIRATDVAQAPVAVVTANPEAITPTETEAVSKAMERHAFGGNLSYVNTDIKNPNQVYATVVIRFKNGGKLPQELVVSMFVDKKIWEQTNPQVGDTIGVRAREIVKGNTALDDGTPVHKFAGMDRAFGIQVLFNRPEVVKTEATEEIKSESLLSRMSNVKAGVLGFFGLGG
jgi:hypothetical protein